MKEKKKKKPSKSFSESGIYIYIFEPARNKSDKETERPNQKKSRILSELTIDIAAVGPIPFRNGVWITTSLHYYLC